MNTHRHQMSPHTIGGTRKTFLHCHHDNTNKYFQSLATISALGTMLTKRCLQQLLALAALPVQHGAYKCNNPCLFPSTPWTEPCIFSFWSTCPFQPRHSQDNPFISLNHSGAKKLHHLSRSQQIIIIRTSQVVLLRHQRLNQILGLRK